MAIRRRQAIDDVPPDELCPAHLVNSLVDQCGFNRDDVVKWTSVKARAILDKYKRDTSNAVSRADGVAQRNDGTTYPPPQPERDEGAGWLAGSMAKSDGWEMRLAMCHAIHLLADDEALRLATHLIQRLKTRPPLPESHSLLGRTTVQPKADGEQAEVGGSIEL